MGMDHIRRVILRKCSSAWLVLLILAIVSYTNDVTATTNSECLDGGISDGRCDVSNNNANCDYDGGDCCECTCVDSAYTCGPYYMCVDPSAECEDYNNHGNINNLGNLTAVETNDGGDGDGGEGRDGGGEDRDNGDDDDNNDGGNLNVVIGSSVGAVVAVIVIAAVYCCFCKKGRTNSAPTTAAAHAGDATPTEAGAPIAYAFAKAVELENPVKTIHAQPPPSAPYETEVK